MGLTSGFFNSLNGDRKYNAEQMSSLFDGIINDGVFANIGTAFSVKANGGNDISIGVGRAWFNSTWINNDSEYIITAEESAVLQNRYDAVVIEVNHSDSVRACSIKIIQGTPATSPIYPILTKTTDIHQYALAFIYRGADTDEITQSNIINCIGGTYCPYVTGILQVQDISKNVAQWEAQWDEWFATKTEAYDSESEAWFTQFQNDATTWFNSIKGTLGEDAAVELASKVIELEANVDKMVKKSGDTMTGSLSFNTSSSTGTATVGRDETVENYFGLHLTDTNAAGKKVGMRLCSGLNIFQILANGVWYDIFSEFRKPTPSEVGAVDKDGDVMFGQLDIQNEGYIGLTKTRTINSKIYTASLGIGNDSARGASISLRLTDPSGTTKGRIDAWENGTLTYTPDGSTFYDLYYANGAKIAFGSYTGSGGSGASSPNILSFAFKPKMILFFFTVNNYMSVGVIAASQLTTSYTAPVGTNDVEDRTNSSGFYAKLSSDGKTVYWYSTADASRQMNHSGYTYYYVALGV